VIQKFWRVVSLVFALYTFFVGVTAKFISTGFEWEINDDIKNGGLNKYIVKPINLNYSQQCRESG